jgi:hypothetical protein
VFRARAGGNGERHGKRQRNDTHDNAGDDVVQDLIALKEPSALRFENADHWRAQYLVFPLIMNIIRAVATPARYWTKGH